MNHKLQIFYDPETDTLDLDNGLPASNGEDIALYVIVFFDNEGQYNMVTIEHAAELLLPHLTGGKETVAGGKPNDGDGLGSTESAPVGYSTRYRASFNKHLPEGMKMGFTTDPWPQISYVPGWDFLWISNAPPFPGMENGLLAPNGVDIAENVRVFFDDGLPNRLLIEHAAELLLPILMAAKEKAPADIFNGED